jgi:hypothetical protein
MDVSSHIVLLLNFRLARWQQKSECEFHLKI